jgi:protein involved in polysaccharide export with SLBB domain
MRNLKNLKVITVLMILLLLNLQFLALPVEALAIERADENNVTKINSNFMETQTGKSDFIAGDGLMIDTFPDTSSFLNNTFSIDDKGMVELPLIGKIKITTMSIAQLEEYLKSQYKAYLRSPNLRVKPLIRVSVLGGVKTPGLFYVDASSSLWDVLKLAGGTTLETGLKDMCWERDGKTVKDDLIPFLQKGFSLSSMGLRSGDQLWTPTTSSSFWGTFNNILPIITLTTTIILFYYTYQQNMIIIQSR